MTKLPRRPAITATDPAASILLLAIDIPEHRHELLIGFPGNRRRRRLSAVTTLEGIARLSGPRASLQGGLEVPPQSVIYKRG